MLTYASLTAKDVTAEQRARLVKSVTAIHETEALGPRYFVHVIFYRTKPGSIFVGGDPASPDHVWVRADICAGRTHQQKAQMLTRLRAETSAILGVSEQDVWVYISDIPAEGVLEFGNVLPEPGEEAQWLAGLPSALRERLAGAA